MKVRIWIVVILVVVFSILFLWSLSLDAQEIKAVRPMIFVPVIQADVNPIGTIPLPTPTFTPEPFVDVVEFTGPDTREQVEEWLLNWIPAEEVPGAMGVYDAEIDTAGVLSIAPTDCDSGQAAFSHAVVGVGEFQSYWRNQFDVIFDQEILFCTGGLTRMCGVTAIGGSVPGLSYKSHTMLSPLAFAKHLYWSCLPDFVPGKVE